jgi:serine/threonine protein kinase
LDIIRQAAVGLSHLHANGVIHRDVRAVNFLVASKEPLSVKITDFGLSHTLENDAAKEYVFSKTSGPIGQFAVVPLGMTLWLRSSQV